MRFSLLISGPGIDTEVTLDPAGNETTIGRDPGADVRLLDADRFISRKHAAIRQASALLVELRVVSAVNAIKTSRGLAYPGQVLQLTDKDYFTLGPYEAVIASIPDEPVEAGRSGVGPGRETSALPEGPAGEADDPAPEADQPWEIPDDWDESISAPRPAPPAVARAGPSPQGTPERSSMTLAALIKGLGLPESYTLDPRSAEHAGAMVRLVVEGLVSLLAARREVRKELRAKNRTMLAGTDNNPLKMDFSTTELIQYFFAVHVSAAYMPPQRALPESVTELQVHEHATLAASRAALEGALKDFEPGRIKETLAGKKRSFLPLLDDARAWQAYERYYRQQSSDFSHWLEQIFDRHFAAAYSIESERLKELRRNPPQ